MFYKIIMLNSAEHEIFLLINAEMPTIVGILTFQGRKNSPAHKCWNSNNCWHSNIYEQEKNILGLVEPEKS